MQCKWWLLLPFNRLALLCATFDGKIVKWWRVIYLPSYKGLLPRQIVLLCEAKIIHRWIQRDARDANSTLCPISLIFINTVFSEKSRWRLGMGNHGSATAIFRDVTTFSNKLKSVLSLKICNILGCWRNDSWRVRYQGDWSRRRRHKVQRCQIERSSRRSGYLWSPSE